MRFAVAVPLAVGANTTLNGTVWPAAIVIGNVIPDRPNSAPVDDAPETVTLAPLAVIDDDCVLLVPTVTFPKLRDVGFADS